MMHGAGLDNNNQQRSIGCSQVEKRDTQKRDTHKSVEVRAKPYIFSAHSHSGS